MSGATVSIRFLARLAVAAAVLIAPTLPGFAGGVAILNVVLSDNGDDDGYADTREAVDMRLTVQNTSGVPLSDVSIQLINETPSSACMTAASVSVGDLAPGEVKLTDAFVFYVGDVDRTTLGLGKHDPCPSASRSVSTRNPTVSRRTRLGSCSTSIWTWPTDRVRRAFSSSSRI